VEVVMLVHAMSWLRRRAGRRYVAGESRSDALDAAHAIGARGERAILAFFNPASFDSESVANEYEQLIRAAATRRLVQAEVSLKLPALGFDQGLFSRLSGAARESGVLLHLDAHGIEAVEPTLAVLRSEASPRPGATLPARWRRSAHDAETLIDLGATVRIVKGQWNAPPDQESDPKEGFLGLARRLAGRAARVKVATHDASLADGAIEILRSAGTDCELELLLGLPSDEPRAIALKHRVPVRWYVPFGEPWPPYLVTLGGLRHRPDAIRWLMSDLQHAIVR
jgi:proline dehydrogenase